jgi:hypothetical protein
MKNAKLTLNHVSSWKNVCAVFLFCAVAAMGIASGQCTSGAAWTEFHTSNMKRFNPCETVLNVGNVANLSLAWSFATSRIYGVYSSPALVNGVVYIGSDNNGAFALQCGYRHRAVEL